MRWILIGMVIGLVLISSASAQLDAIKEVPKVEYSNTNLKVCDKDSCTLQLFSGIRFVEESRGWVRIEDSEGSLMDYFSVVHLKEDEKYDFHVKNLTYNCITIEPFIRFVGDTGKDIPLKVDDKTIGTLRIPSVFSVRPDIKICMEEDNTMSINDGTNTWYDQREWSETPLGMSYTFGEHSTTIQLQVADTENLEDNCMLENVPDANQGPAFYIRLSGTVGYVQRGIIKFNNTIVPSGQSIDDARLFLYIYMNGLDNSEEGYNVSVHHHYNQTWVETYPTWNKIVDLGSYNTTEEDDKRFFGGSGKPIGWDANFSVTNMVAKAYADGDENISFYLKPHDVFGSPATNDILDIRAKEYATTSLRPYLNITYSELPSHCWSETEGSIIIPAGCEYVIPAGEEGII